MLCWAEGTQHAANALCKASKSVSCPLVRYIRLLEIQPANNTAEKPSKEETFSTLTSPHVKAKQQHYSCHVKYLRHCVVYSALASVPDVGVGKQNPYRRCRDSNYTTLTENIQISSQSEWHKTDTLLITNANWQIAFRYTCSLLTRQRTKVRGEQQPIDANSLISWPQPVSLQIWKPPRSFFMMLWASQVPDIWKSLVFCVCVSDTTDKFKKHWWKRQAFWIFGDLRQHDVAP